MKKTWLYACLLALFAPLFAEMLNGSTPISALAHPAAWIFVLLPYSLLILVLGYFAARTPSAASRLFLLPVAGLAIEGLLTHSFFNLSFVPLGPLAGIGYAGGVQWPWTFSLLASHAMTSFLLPLAAAGFFFPENAQDVNKKAAIASGTAFGLAAVASLIIAPPLAHLGAHALGTAALIFMCILLSQKMRIPDTQVRSASWIWFALAGFACAPLNWLTSFFIADRAVSIVLLAQGIFLAVLIYFLWLQWFNPRTSARKRLAFAIAFFLPYLIALITFSALGHR